MTRYTKVQLRFLKHGYRTMRVPELTAAFNAEFGLEKPESSIRSTLRNHRFTCGRRPGFRTGEKRRLLTREQEAYLRRAYAHTTAARTAELLNERFGLNVTARQVRTFTKSHQITCTRTGRFRKGQTPPNKGTKGLMKPNRTSFRKGDVPRNTRPLWSERICTKDGYVLIKVPEPNPYTGAETRYKHKHIWIWEQAHGAVPEGSVVTFIDGDKLNCELGNLTLVSRAELQYLNRWLRYDDAPAEVRPSLIALARVECKRFEVQKNV